MPIFTLLNTLYLKLKKIVYSFLNNILKEFSFQQKNIGLIFRIPAQLSWRPVGGLCITKECRLKILYEVF